MEISNKHLYFSLTYDLTEDLHSAVLSEDLKQTIIDWTANSRISPVWSIVDEDAGLLARDDIKSCELFIFGPCNPFHLKSDTNLLAEDCNFHLWMSLGLMNLIALPLDEKSKSTLRAWLCAKHMNFEVWTIDSEDRLTNVERERHLKEDMNSSWKPELAALVQTEPSTSLGMSLSEFAPLIASGIQRASFYDPKIVHELTELISYVSGALEEQREMDESVAAALISTVNAGLSRYTSQTLSGVIPIFATESHFWVHSLFGIGIAGMGLRNLVQYISQHIGAAFIPNRILQLKNETGNVPNLLKMTKNDPFWKTDHLDSTVPATDGKLQLEPDVTFFSGRDGFKTHLTNVSAPLTAVFSCNSERWSLQTITHEISHKIIKAILSLLIPVKRADEHSVSLEEAEALLNKGGTQDNWLDAIRVWIWTSSTQLEAADRPTGESGDDIYPLNCLEERYSDIEEIMAHVFDFLYFYNSEVDSYIRELWMTWSVIPNISNRKEDYIVRSVCAVLSINLHRESAVDISIDRVRSGLIKVQEKDPDTQYVSDAIDYINNNRERISDCVIARRQLVRFVRTFVFSSSIQSSMWHESNLTGGEPDTLGYPQRLKHLEGHMIDNPLLFLSAYSKSKKGNAASSAWIYSNLSFNLSQTLSGESR